MQIIEKELAKTLPIFKILELSETQIKEHLEKINTALLMDAAAEAFARKGKVEGDSNFEPEEVEDFLLDNFDEEEIEEIISDGARDVIVEYFSKILKDVPEEKMQQINQILNTNF